MSSVNAVFPDLLVVELPNLVFQILRGCQNVKIDSEINT